MRTRDWLRQAEKDLEHARRDVAGGDYEWACFSAQQAAEKAVKALYQSIHVEVAGHSVTKMLQDLPPGLGVPSQVIELAKGLDKHYIPTRYPNFHTEGAPLDYYTRAEAEKAVEYGSEIIRFCRSKIPRDQL